MGIEREREKEMYLSHRNDFGVFDARNVSKVSVAGSDLLPIQQIMDGV